MKKLVLILGLFVTLNTNVWAEEIKDELYPHYVERSDEIISTVQKFKDLLKTDNPQLIAQNVVYPFSLGWGVPSVQNEQEFIERYIRLIQNGHPHIIRRLAVVIVDESSSRTCGKEV